MEKEKPKRNFVTVASIPTLYPSERAQRLVRKSIRPQKTTTTIETLEPDASPMSKMLANRIQARKGVAAAEALTYKERGTTFLPPLMLEEESISNRPETQGTTAGSELMTTLRDHLSVRESSLGISACFDVMEELWIQDFEILRRRFLAAPEKELSLLDFVAAIQASHGLLSEKAKRKMRSRRWRMRLVQNITELFHRIDVHGTGKITWEEFGDYVIYGTSHSLHLGNRLGADMSKYAERPTVILHEMNHVENVFAIPEMGKVLVCSKTAQAQFFGITTGMPGRSLHGHSAYILTALYIPEEKRLVTAAADRLIIVWDDSTLIKTKQGRCINPQLCLEWDSRNKHLISGGPDGFVRFWEFDVAHVKEVLTWDHAHTDWVTDLCMMEDLHLLASCSLDGVSFFLLAQRKEEQTVKIWDMEKLSLRMTLTGHRKGIFNLAYVPKAKVLVSAGMDHDIFVWNPFVMGAIQQLRGHEASLLGVAAMGNIPEVISIDKAGHVMVWDMLHYEVTQHFEARADVTLEESKSYTSFAVDTVNKQVIGLLLDRLHFWMCVNDTEHTHGLTVASNVSILLYNKTFHSVLVVSGLDDVSQWDPHTGKAIAQYRGIADGEISCMAFDQRERLMLVGTVEGSVGVFNITTGLKVRQWSAAEGAITGLCVVSAWRFCICSLNGSASIVEIAKDSSKGQRIIFQWTHPGDCPVFAYSELCGLVGMGGAEGRFRVYRVDAGSMFGEIHLGGADVVACVFADALGTVICADSYKRLVFCCMGDLHPIAVMHLDVRLPSTTIAFSKASEHVVVDLNGGSEVVIVDARQVARRVALHIASQKVSGGSSSDLERFRASGRWIPSVLVDADHAARSGDRFPLVVPLSAPDMGYSMQLSKYAIARWVDPDRCVRCLSWTSPTPAVIVGNAMGRVGFYGLDGTHLGQMGSEKEWLYQMNTSAIREERRSQALDTIEKMEKEEHPLRTPPIPRPRTSMSQHRRRSQRRLNVLAPFFSELQRGGRMKKETPHYMPKRHRMKLTEQHALMEVEEHSSPIERKAAVDTLKETMRSRVVAGKRFKPLNIEHKIEHTIKKERNRRKKLLEQKTKEKTKEKEAAPLKSGMSKLLGAGLMGGL